LQYSCDSFSHSNIWPDQKIAPEVAPARIEEVSNYVTQALGDLQTNTKDQRYASARKATSDLQNNDLNSDITSSELVYGELSVPVLARLFNAVGIKQNEKILDVGSGDGGLVFGSSLLLAGLHKDEERNALGKCNYVQKVTGLEIVPGLYERSIQFGKEFRGLISRKKTFWKDESMLDNDSDSIADFEFRLGDIYQTHEDALLQEIIQDTTLVICFATTWSAGNANSNNGSKISLQKRNLPKLSSALSYLPKGARAVIVDGKLDCDKDGFRWGGDLRIECPDTAPYSVASLYEKIS